MGSQTARSRMTPPPPLSARDLQCARSFRGIAPILHSRRGPFAELRTGFLPPDCGELRSHSVPFRFAALATRGFAALCRALRPAPAALRPIDARAEAGPRCSKGIKQQGMKARGALEQPHKALLHPLLRAAAWHSVPA